MAYHTNKSRQRGAVLVVGLLTLLVMTVIGISSMNTSNLEEKMAGNTRDREIAFQAAESALREAERAIEGGASGWSFDITCTNGRCDCTPATFTSSPCPEYWTDATINVWGTNTPTRHFTYSSAINNVASRAKYIIEYLGQYNVPDDPVCSTCPKRYYRITSLATGMTPSSRVMLQSTYRVE